MAEITQEERDGRKAALDQALAAAETQKLSAAETMALAREIWAFLNGDAAPEEAAEQSVDPVEKDDSPRQSEMQPARNLRGSMIAFPSQ